MEVRCTGGKVHGSLHAIICIPHAVLRVGGFAFYDPVALLGGLRGGLSNLRKHESRAQLAATIWL